MKTEASRNKEQGFVLVVAMIFMTITVLLGLSGVTSSRFDETMASANKVATSVKMGADQAAATGLEGLSLSSFGGGAEIMNNESDMSDLYSWSTMPGDDGGCQLVSCKFSYIVVDSTDGSDLYGKKNGEYIVGLSAIVGSDDSEVAISEPVFVRVGDDGGTGVAKLEAALTVLGGIEAVINANNDNQKTQWLPSSSNAAIAGGLLFDTSQDPWEPVLDESGEQVSLASLYYEGPLFDMQSISGNNPLKSSPVEAGESDSDSVSMVLNLILGIKASFQDDPALVDSVLGTNAEIEDALIDHDSSCAASTSYIAIVENYEASGSGKYCGMIISLGDTVTMGGTVAIDGALVAANPLNPSYVFSEWSDPTWDEATWEGESGAVDVVFQGGGGQGQDKDYKGGSVRFNVAAMDYAFDKFGLNYLDFMTGGTDKYYYYDYVVLSWE